MHKRTWLVAMVTTLALLGAACGSEGGGDATDDAGAQDTAEPIELTITAHDFKFDGPEEVEAGTVDFTLTNDGKEPHQVQLFKIDEGSTYEDVAAGLKKGDPEPVLEIVTAAGGIGSAAGIPPGSEWTGSFELAEGSYAIVCFVHGHNSKGMYAPLEVVEGEAEAAALPEAEGQITLSDMKFTVDDSFDGSGTYEFVNAGPSTHEAAIYKINGTLEEVQAFAEDPSGPPPGKGEPESAGGVSWMEAGQSTVLDVDLEPGVYAFLCFWSDEESKGKAHYELGMIEAFEVE